MRRIFAGWPATQARDLLSSGFSATAGLTFDTDGQGLRVFTVEQVEKQVRLAIVSFYNALTLVANYHGQRPPLLVNWEDEVLRVLPGVLAASRGTE